MRLKAPLAFVVVVFEVPSDEELQRRPLAWWRFAKGANWRQPMGPGSKPPPPNFPVTLVTQADALAYAHWLGRDLPTEAEWEYAGKAGRSDAQHLSRQRRQRNQRRRRID